MLGEGPSDSAAAPAPGIPEVSAPAALGMPQQLIRRRPDIRIAERQLAAQSAQIGVATADLYPSFSIGGSIGTAAADTGELFESGNKTWSLLGAFQWNLFNYGRLKSNVRLQDARFQQLLEDYRNVVLQAQADVENSIVSYLRAHDQMDAYQLAAEAAERAVEIATTQYKQGEIEFITLIVTLQSATQQEDFLAATQGAVATNLVQVYRALGGGWEFREATTPDELLPEATRNEMIERTRYWKPVLQ